MSVVKIVRQHKMLRNENEKKKELRAPTLPVNRNRSTGAQKKGEPFKMTDGRQEW
jgi:hypothetical protein